METNYNGKHSNRYLGPYLWHKLPGNVQTQCDLNSFKRQIKKMDLEIFLLNNFLHANKKVSSIQSTLHTLANHLIVNMSTVSFVGLKTASIKIRSFMYYAFLGIISFYSNITYPCLIHQNKK